MAFYTYPFFFFLLISKQNNQSLLAKVHIPWNGCIHVHRNSKQIKERRLGMTKSTHIYIYVFINQKKQTIIYNKISDTLNVMMNMKL